MNFAKMFLLSAGMLLGFGLSAQTIKGVLVDESTGEALGFATVSLTRDGQTKPVKYTLSRTRVLSLSNPSVTVPTRLSPS